MKTNITKTAPPEPAKTHCIELCPSPDEFDAWSRVAAADAMTFSQWALATMKAAATKTAARKMRWNAFPAGPRNQLPIMFTESDDKAFKAQAKACGVPVAIWAYKTLKAACVK